MTHVRLLQELMCPPVHSAAEPACSSQTPQEEGQEAGQREDTSPDSLVSLALPGYLVVTVLYSICMSGVNFRYRHAHTQARIHTQHTHTKNPHDFTRSDH